MAEEKKTCRNCGSELAGEYCSTCGQRDVELKVPLTELVKEFADEFLSFDARLFRSIVPFLLKPGLLTVEYISGRRARFVSPFKIYFFMSFVYFFAAAMLDQPADRTAAKEHVNVDSLLKATVPDSLVRFGKTNQFKFTYANGDSSKIERKLGHRFAAGLNKVKSDPQSFHDKLRDHTPQVIFLLLPVFALLLKLLYIRSKTFYIQHIVFSFYFHAYVFFVLLLINVLGSIGGNDVGDYASLLYLAIPVNLFQGMRRVYVQSRSKTFAKFSLLVSAYGCVLIAAVVATVFVLISLL